MTMKSLITVHRSAISHVIGYKVDIKLHCIEFNQVLWGGRGVRRSPRLSTRGGGGGQDWVKIGPRSC